MTSTTLLSNGFGRNALIPLLQKVQAEMGYVPKEAIDEISKELKVSASEIFGVLTFYAQFRLKPLGNHTAKICTGTACHVRGAPFIVDAIEEELGLTGDNDTTEDNEFTVERVACFGACALAPVAIVDEKTYGSTTPDKMRRLIKKMLKQIEKENASAEEVAHASH